MNITHTNCEQRTNPYTTVVCETTTTTTVAETTTTTIVDDTVPTTTVFNTTTVPHTLPPTGNEPNVAASAGLILALGLAVWLPIRLVRR